ncbi:MAG TPA: winged helix-turn-helix domain-containing protein [Pyrinomonadaceae bacterium]|jgi:DNA-binding response OmpR family regulator
MSVKEMSIARVEKPSQSDDIYDDGYLRIEHRNYYLACHGEALKLPRTEFLIMSRLARSAGRIVPAEELWSFVWGDNKPLNSESLHVYIYRLRNKLLPYNVFIDTMVNVGYKLMVHEPRN